MSNVRGRSDIKGTSVCYIWPARDISMSLQLVKRWDKYMNANGDYMEK
jgi:hypothetical protein